MNRPATLPTVDAGHRAIAAMMAEVETQVAGMGLGELLPDERRANIAGLLACCLRRVMKDCRDYDELVQMGDAVASLLTVQLPDS